MGTGDACHGVQGCRSVESLLEPVFKLCILHGLSTMAQCSPRKLDVCRVSITPSELGSILARDVRLWATAAALCPVIESFAVIRQHAMGVLARQRAGSARPGIKAMLILHICTSLHWQPSVACAQCLRNQETSTNQLLCSPELHVPGSFARRLTGVLDMQASLPTALAHCSMPPGWSASTAALRGQPTWRHGTPYRPPCMLCRGWRLSDMPSLRCMRVATCMLQRSAGAGWHSCCSPPGRGSCWKRLSVTSTCCWPGSPLNIFAMR